MGFSATSTGNLSNYGPTVLKELQNSALLLTVVTYVCMLSVNTNLCIQSLPHNIKHASGIVSYQFRVILASHYVVPHQNPK